MRLLQIQLHCLITIVPKYQEIFRFQQHDIDKYIQRCDLTLEANSIQNMFDGTGMRIFEISSDVIKILRLLVRMKSRRKCSLEVLWHGIVKDIQ